MPINPLPQFEADLKEHLQDEADRLAYEKLNAPSTIVVRFGYLQMIGEFPYSGDSKPGCGSKLVVQTPRGTEIGEMLTSTCQNSGCSKSVTRKEMLQYIENSGGRQYPFFDRGQVLRIATVDDLNTQRHNEQRKNEIRMIAKRMVEQAGLEMKIIEAEPIFGGERVVIYFGAEDRVDFRDLVADLSREVGTKVELRQIGARDEARITADYERCGQYCCCKNFLKVLKPVSMKSAKIQKATLDPLKISGRCGRLMCCLRYEDETYDQLRKNLPHRKSRVGTPDGDGIVISTQILTQLAMVRLDNNTDVAIPIEELTDPVHKVAPEPGQRGGGGRSGAPGASDRSRNSKRGEGRSQTRDDAVSGSGSGKQKRTRRGQSENQPEGRVEVQKENGPPREGDQSKKKKKRQRRRRGGSGSESQSDAGGQSSARPKNEQTRTHVAGEGSAESGSGPKKKKKRRRRRPGGSSGADGASGSGDSSGSGDTGNGSGNGSGNNAD